MYFHGCSGFTAAGGTDSSLYGLCNTFNKNKDFILWKTTKKPRNAKQVCKLLSQHQPSLTIPELSNMEASAMEGKLEEERKKERK